MITANWWAVSRSMSTTALISLSRTPSFAKSPHNFLNARCTKAVGILRRPLRCLQCTNKRRETQTQNDYCNPRCACARRTGYNGPFFLCWDSCKCYWKRIVICISRVLDAHLPRTMYCSLLYTCVAYIISRDDIYHGPGSICNCKIQLNQ